MGILSCHLKVSGNHCNFFLFWISKIWVNFSSPDDFGVIFVILWLFTRFFPHNFNTMVHVTHYPNCWTLFMVDAYEAQESSFQQDLMAFSMTGCVENKYTVVTTCGWNLIYSSSMIKNSHIFSLWERLCLGRNPKFYIFQVRLHPVSFQVWKGK